MQCVLCLFAYDEKWFFLLGAFGQDALEIRQEGKSLRRAKMTWVKIRKQLLKRGKPNHLYLIQFSPADFSEI